MSKNSVNRPYGHVLIAGFANAEALCGWPEEYAKAATAQPQRESFPQF
jgi:hypothetical protein